MTGLSDSRPSLLILGSMFREMREYLLASISTRYRVHMVLAEEPTWQSRYITGTSVVANPRDDASLVAVATDLSKVEPFAGVLTWDEARAAQAASLAEALGLPGPGRAAVARCRDKHETRTALAAGNVGQPRSVKASTVTEALSAAEDLGYPVVIKPNDLAMSIGVVKVDNPAQLREQFELAAALKARWPDYHVQILVEEFVDGDEISVDCAVHDGNVTILCLARKVTGYPPYFIEVGHIVDAADPLLGDQTLLALLCRTHAALGFDHGLTHTEIRFSRSGPKIIEVNARLGGDLIPYLGQRATGVDVGLAAAAVACGRPPVAVADRKLVAGIRFFHLDHGAGTIDSVYFDESAITPATDRLRVLAVPGQYLSAPTVDPAECRVAFATAVGASQESCTHTLDTAERALRITLRQPAK